MPEAARDDEARKPALREGWAGIMFTRQATRTQVAANTVRCATRCSTVMRVRCSTSGRQHSLCSGCLTLTFGIRAAFCSLPGSGGRWFWAVCSRSTFVCDRRLGALAAHPASRRTRLFPRPRAGGEVGRTASIFSGDGPRSSGMTPSASWYLVRTLSMFTTLAFLCRFQHDRRQWDCLRDRRCRTRRGDAPRGDPSRAPDGRKEVVRNRVGQLPFGAPRFLRTCSVAADDAGAAGFVSTTGSVTTAILRDLGSVFVRRPA